MLAGFVCALAALCYAELAAMIPVAGSAYTYTYATLGEFVAWIIAWDLIVEYLFAASTVAVGWSGYFVGLLRDVGIVLPGRALTQAPFDAGRRLPPDGHRRSTCPPSPSPLMAALILVTGITRDRRRVN